MKKTLILIIALFVLTMFATVSAHGNQDNLSTSDHRIVAVNGPDGPQPQDPPQPPHKHKHKPQPKPEPPQPGPGPN